MSSPDRTDEYSLVRQIRQTISKISQEVSDKTKQDYVKKYQRMKASGTTPESAGTKNGYYAYRAALLYGIAVEARQALNLRDKSAYGSQEWQSAMSAIHCCQLILKRYPPDPERNHRYGDSASFTWSAIKSNRLKTATGWNATISSKKRVLSKLRNIPDWRTRLFQQVTPKHKNAAAICILTGCRPSEIARGVKIELVDSQDGQRLLITIRGSKITATSGQPERKLSIRIDTDEARHLAQLANNSSVTVTTHPANFCAAIIKAGRVTFPNLQETVSPYVFRHALASDLKASNASLDAIAQIMGHQATESQQAYGFAVSQSGVVHIDGVIASIPVRDTHRNPRNHLGQRFSAPSPR